MSPPTTKVFEAQLISHLRMHRGQAVILDSDLAWFLGIEPAVIIVAVKNHPTAFPGDFVFRLTLGELDGLEKGAPCLTDTGLAPEQDRFAFTTHGAGMLLVVLRDEKFALAAIPVLRAFANYWKETEGGQNQKPLGNRTS